MPNFILFDDESRFLLRPFTFFRPVSEIRCGILTIREKWEKLLSSTLSFLTEPYLQPKYKLTVASDNLLINSCLLPDLVLASEILSLPADTVMQQNNFVIAIRLSAENLRLFSEGHSLPLQQYESNTYLRKLIHTWDITEKNAEELVHDFKLITTGRESQMLPLDNQHVGDNIFIEEGAQILFSTLDATSGPIFIGKEAHIMPGSHVQGPAAICEHATLKMGSLIYGGTTIGPWCKAGGEISNSIMFGYSSKAHDGYLGNSVIGEWCNLGAGTTCSNLKNNYQTVKQWDYAKNRFTDTGLVFCGLAMGDHCKTGINTMFNSGTTVGVCSNVFGSGYQRNFISSFAWGGTAGFRKHKIEEAIATAQVVYARRGLEFGLIEQNIMRSVGMITSENHFL